jgi:hypothetical protein
MKESTKNFVNNFIFPLALIITLSLAGLFLQVSGNDSRINVIGDDVEILKEEVNAITDSYSLIKQDQEQILYTLCLLVNDNDLSKC